MNYPSRIIKAGEHDAAVVRALKRRLDEALGNGASLKLDLDSPNFGSKMRQAVKLFQARTHRPGRTARGRLDHDDRRQHRREQDPRRGSVYRLTRKIVEINKGFIQYAA